MKLQIKTFSIIIFFLFSILNKTIGQNIVINEFMSDNETILADEDGDFSDWIEIYNNSSSSINLLNYSLSDKSTDLQQWKFPEITIAPYSFLLVFASDKNRLDTNELHTNFKISSSGEALFLSNPMGQIIDQIESVALTENKAFGRLPNGANDFSTLAFPTPNSSNNINNQITFAYTSGFYPSPFFQKINSLLGDTIYYTLDGSVPTESSNIFPDSLKMDYNYSTPNLLSNIPTTIDQSQMDYKAWEAPHEIVDKANILRCASYKNGERTSDIFTQTYFVDSTIYEKYSMPVISLVTDTKNLFDYNSGIYTTGINFDENAANCSGNCFQRGELWEKPVHIEYFEQGGSLGFSQNAGIEIHGGKTRQAAQKSLRLSAKNIYGKKHFEYPLMPNRLQAQYKSFVLQTTVGAWERTIISDVYAHEISRGLNISYRDFRPVVVFINGEYWGIHNIRDRIDERYLAYSYGLDKDSVEFRGYYNFPYLYLMEYIEANDLSESYHYDTVATEIDVDNFIDYYIAEMFIKNFDWPANNMRLWKEKNSNGIWRWIFYDLDASFGDYNYNMFEHLSETDTSIIWPNSPSSTFLFRNLIKNEGFQNQFVHRYQEILRNDFHRDTLTKKLNEIVALYEPEIERHISRWNFPSSYSDWKKSIEERMLTFIKIRPCVVEANLVDFFNLSNYDFICFKNSANEPNDKFTLFPNPNDGNFFVYNKSEEKIIGDLRIIDLMGKIIYFEKDVTFEENTIKDFTFLNLSSGSYFFSFQNSKFINSMKFVVSN